MANVVGILFDEMNSQVQCQITRDLMTLHGEFDVEVNTNDHAVQQWLGSLQIPPTTAQPDLYLVYRVKDWPAVPAGAEIVKRDLKPRSADISIDPNPKIGYFLKDQGRPGANRTEQYLNRQAPRGKGITDPAVIMMWSSAADKDPA